MTKNEDLAQIIDGCKAGDSGSFSRLIDIYSNRFYGYFYRATGDKTISDDLLSELFVKLVSKIGSFRGGSFEGWLWKIASNIFHDYLRGKQREKKLVEAQKKELLTELTEPRQAENEQTDKLQTALANVDADLRELIMLRFYSELSFKEISKLRGEPIGTVLSKVHRGLKKLRELME